MSNNVSADLLAFAIRQVLRETRDGAVLPPHHQEFVDLLDAARSLERRLRALVQRWDDQPDYRDEWLP